jgi:hypothetical protein
MAVEETIELCTDLHNQLRMLPSSIVCNLASPLVGMADCDFEQICESLVPEETGRHAIRFVLDRHRNEVAWKKRLQSAVAGTIHSIPRASKWNSDVELLMFLGDKLAACLEHPGS